MRCPKCSFISFDDLKNCAKCSNDLAALSQQLQGTCSETRLPFFLASVVQAPESEDQTLSDSQSLPAIDDTDINFDDSLSAEETVSFEADPTLTGFDDSIEISEDDISLELGDIMPIDLDQLDEPGELDEDLDADSTQALTTEIEDHQISLEDIDLDLGEDFSADQSSEFDVTEILKTDQVDEEINFDMTGDFDESIDLDLSGDFEGFNFDDTTLVSSDGSAEQLSYDDTLSEADNFSLKADEDKLPATGEFPAIDHDQTEVLELDDTLFADLDTEDIEAADEVDLETGPGEFMELEDDMLEELEPASVDDDRFAEIVPTGIAPDDSGLGLEPGLGSEEFRSDDTLSDEISLGLDEEAETSPPSADATLEFDAIGGARSPEDTVLDEAPADSDLPSRPAGQTPGSFEPADFELGADLEEDNESEDPDRLGDELLATMDDEMDFDVAELEGVPDQSDRGESADQSRSGDTPSATADFGFAGYSDDSDFGPEDDDLIAMGQAPSLGLEEIDVSDLVSEAKPADDDPGADDNNDELDLTSLMEEGEAGRQGDDRDQLSEDIPEIELVDDDEDEGPPDLP